MIKAKPFKIYLANLTHTHVALASGTFPLGISYVASALKSYFGDRVEVEIFKYPFDLEEAIKKDPPDAYFFSTYVWTHYLTLAFARRIRAKYPEALIVGGGPNISMNEGKREAFLREHPEIDFFVINEGERPAVHLIKRYFDLGYDKDKLKEEVLPSVCRILPSGSYRSGDLAPRIGRTKTFDDALYREADTFTAFENLKDVPSPYLSGLMDKFFDNRLYPLIQTNRGCPFTCSFCQEGASYFTKVIPHSFERVIAELDYIADHIIEKSPDISMLEISDSNFGMFDQDVRICEHIRKIQDRNHWPSIIGCSTGKNRPEIILNAVARLRPDTLSIVSAMQSTNPPTLDAVKRKNINLDGYRKIQTEVHKRGLKSSADMILGLPEETKKSHFKAIYELIDSGVKDFTTFQSMNLKGTELELQETKDKYGFMTKWRLLPRSIGEYPVCGEPMILAEIEEITVGTNRLSFEDYLSARKLHLITLIYHNSLFELFHQYLKGKGVNPSVLIGGLYRYAEREDFPLAKVIREFIAESQTELFDTEEECLEYYTRPETLRKVEAAEVGGNLMFKYLSIALFEYWDETVQGMMTCLKEMTEIEGAVSDELEALIKAELVDITEPKIVQDKKVIIKNAKTAEFLQVAGVLPKDFTTLPFAIDLVLKEDKYVLLCGAQKVYPNNRTGRSLALANVRVMAITRVLEIATLHAQSYS